MHALGVGFQRQKKLVEAAQLLHVVSVWLEKVPRVVGPRQRDLSLRLDAAIGRRRGLHRGDFYYRFKLAILHA